MTVAIAVDLELRARQSLGSSHDAIYATVAAAIARHRTNVGRLVDVGCGGGGLHRAIGSHCSSYCGFDAVRYDSLPSEVEFHYVDLDQPDWPVRPVAADVVAAVETIEHLENPWAFMRQLAPLAVPGGLVLVTTPNQLSALSLLTLLTKRRFSAFQDAHYPAHRTALLACDLVRAATVAGLEVLEVSYTESGRVPLTPWHFPRWLSALAPRWLSDNLLLVARRPHD